ncbi:MAG: CDP-alcohol phosphatidyltransferase family protein [Candidatus Caenarcaniphilales bacterium]|nr:CDP-alcohol phosphatidyltransferase family protein [Candidatus Caenarcaniphilales bacterium]
MPTIYDLKPKFQNFLEPALTLLVKLKITANQLTIATLVLSYISTALVYYFGLFKNIKEIIFLIPVTLFIRMALNALDGMLARETNTQSRLGEVLNEVGDILADILIYSSLIFVFGKPELMLLITIFKFVFLTMLSEFCGVLAKTTAGTRANHGPMGKSDRAFVIGALCFIYYFVPISQQALEIIFVVLTILLLVTCFNRLKQAVRG